MDQDRRVPVAFMLIRSIRAADVLPIVVGKEVPVLDHQSLIMRCRIDMVVGHPVAGVLLANAQLIVVRRQAEEERGGGRIRAVHVPWVLFRVRIGRVTRDGDASATDCTSVTVGGMAKKALLRQRTSLNQRSAVMALGSGSHLALKALLDEA
ncbi:MAG: hypothetical protein DLM61_13820 [Pseudonocardiales bacterium]|nr:MAG: hypothetical protein DLM61_13820 [Pseudonocardiales bacterium]